MKRTVFYISDGTGITARAFGRSLLTQFESCEFEEITAPYIDTAEKAKDLITEIDQYFSKTQQQPLLFATIVNPDIHDLLKQSQGLLLDFFHTFIGPLERALQCESSHSIGKTHSMQNQAEYLARIDAINYTLSSDDGNNIRNYDKADFILIGVSRCGKTPTCLYLALQFAIKAANYPFTADDMTKLQLPDFLQAQRHKLFGLSIDAHRLHMIRSQRRPNSHYASLKQCRTELAHIEQLFSAQGIPFINTTMRSIEEIATVIMNSQN